MKYPGTMRYELQGPEYNTVRKELYLQIIQGSDMYEPGTRAPICKRLRSPGIDSARLHRLAESILWNRFLGSLIVHKFGLRKQESDLFAEIKNSQTNNLKFQAQECKQKVLYRNKESRELRKPVRVQRVKNLVIFTKTESLYFHTF